MDPQGYKEKEILETMKKSTTKTEQTATKGNGKAEKQPGIGDIAKAALRNGASPQEALDAVLKAYPNANTKLASIYWYASKEGIDLQARRNNAVKPETGKAADKRASKKAVTTSTRGGRTVVKEPAGRARKTA